MKDFMLRLAIVMSLILGGAICGFTELGIATAFDMKFDGLSYMEYLKEFYSVGWHTGLAFIIVTFALVLSAESIYRSIKNKK